MKETNRIALYVAYYLSRFDMEGYANLGFSSRLEAHKNLGNILSINPNTLKNMRDEFDPLHGHRAGWYQRPMSPSRLEVVKALEDLDEEQLRIIVEEILDASANYKLEKIKKLLTIFSDESEKSDNVKTRYVLRGTTGKKAEDYFIDFHKTNRLPIDGKLKDTRTMGCGYDFEILKDGQQFFIEVKGLSVETGGILFTNKEWKIAKESGDKYFLALVSNLSETPDIKFIRNPALKLTPEKQIFTAIQVQWIVPEKAIKMK